MTEKLSERMSDYCREDDPLRLEIMALETENKQLRELKLEWDRIWTEGRKTNTELESRLSRTQEDYNWRLEKCFGFRDATDINCESCPPILLKCCVIATKKALGGVEAVLKGGSGSS